MGKGIGDDIRQMGVVTKYELLKHLRSRKMFIFVGITALMFILVTALRIAINGELPKDPTKFMEAYLGLVDLLLIIGVSLFCASAIASEFEERTALLMFPRPIKKTSLFIGKMMACYIVCGGILALYYGICIIFSLLNTGGLDTNVFGSLGMGFMFMFGAGGFALLMSTVFKKASTAVIVTIATLLLILQIVCGILEAFKIEPVFSITYMSKDILNFISGHTSGVPPGLEAFVEMAEKWGVSLMQYYPTHAMAFGIAATWAIATTAISVFLFSRKEF